MSTHSAGYLAGIGAIALGLPQHANPFGYDDLDNFSDFLNGYADGKPAQDEDGNDVATLTDQLDTAEENADGAIAKLGEALDDASSDLGKLVEQAVAVIQSADKAADDLARALDMPDTALPDLVAAAVGRLTGGNVVQLKTGTR